MIGLILVLSAFRLASEPRAYAAPPAGCWENAGGYKQTASDVIYKKTDPKNKLDIYIPKDALPPYKTVLEFHGGCYRGGDKRDGYDLEQVRRLTNAGYAVVSVNYRLVDLKAKKNFYPASLEDAQDALRWVRANGSKYELKTDQLVAFGYSAGATLASYLGTRTPRVEGVIDLFGRTDFVHGRGEEAKYEEGRDCGEVYLGAKRDATTAKQFETASVVDHVDADAAKFLILHGDKDKDVSFQHSQLLFTKLVAMQPADAKDVSKKFRFFTIKGAEHMFGKPGEMDQAWQKICPFLVDVLGAPSSARTALK